SNLQHDISVIREDDEIDTGNYTFKCIETPGHSPGHMCLYEAEKKILIAGDLILFDITPNITRWPEMKNSLKDYLNSLEKVKGLDVDLVLPGHRNRMNDHRERIDELLEHHEMRLKEITASLEEGDKTAWEVAPRISWDIVGSWERFPPAQKWFAIGETIAHLKYLEAEGTARVKEKNGQRLYSIR
ncbi:MAG: MBL fold metallo-hydrolase, partial [Deltaproteobacteria bacterium]|nr:MBL fold metallo-hydrolase [Deltaproteobacteria bacterium]